MAVVLVGLVLVIALTSVAAVALHSKSIYSSGSASSTLRVQDPNSRVLVPEHHEYYSIWALKPYYLGPWTLRGSCNRHRGHKGGWWKRRICSSPIQCMPEVSFLRELRAIGCATKLPCQVLESSILHPKPYTSVPSTKYRLAGFAP